MTRKVNYKNYFELNEHSGKDLYNVPFEFKYYVDSEPSMLYIASFDGATYHNCMYSRDSNTLTVFFENQELGLGQLLCEKTFHMPFVGPDGNKDWSYKDSYDVILIEGEEVDPGAPSGQGLVNKELRDAIKLVNQRVDVLKTDEAKQNEDITKLNSSVSTLDAKTKQTEKDVEAIDQEQSKQGQELQDYMASNDQDIKRLENKIEQACDCSKDKGTFESPASLKVAIPTPKVGDSAYVQAPANSSTFDPAKYWGDLYLGKREEKSTEWHKYTTNATGLYFKADTKYYYVCGEVALQLLADDSMEVLLEHGHVKEITIEQGTTIPYHLYICKAQGTWVNTFQTRNFTLPQNVSASNVYDGQKQQSQMNLIDQANATISNRNTEQLLKVINSLVGVVNDLQKKVALTEGRDYTKVPTIALGYLVADGTDDHKRLDFSPLPILLS